MTIVTVSLQERQSRSIDPLCRLRNDTVQKATRLTELLQHRHKYIQWVISLPAMCHTQLARRWPWSTGDRVDYTWPVAVLTVGS